MHDALMADTVFGMARRVDDGRPSATTLRLVWPQWQGATAENVSSLLPEVPFDEARLGYMVGTAVLTAVLPPHDGPTAVVPVVSEQVPAAVDGGIESRSAVSAQLVTALDLIAQHDPVRIVTLGGDCAVSVAPFSALAERYPDDLAIVWIDSHPDVGTPQSDYPGYHAMAVALLTGHGDDSLVDLLPAIVPPAHVALAGLHSWTDDDYPNIAKWGISAFGPDALRTDSQALLDWLRSTGCTHLAIHVDVDVVDSDEATFGLGVEPGGLSIDQVRRVVADLGAEVDVVGLTVAEFIPRQVLQLQRMLRGFPLLS